MDLLGQPIATAEFLAVDTETNGLGGTACEMTEIGAVLIGGGETHERWSSLVRTNLHLRRGIQRFTGISQSMVDSAPAAESVLPELARRMTGRVLVAHNAPFDRRVLRQAFERVGLEWPDPPILCTAALARMLLPLQRERKLAVLADALGVEVASVHRALPDAQTCALIFCALFPRLCTHSATVGDAVALTASARPKRARSAKPKAAGGRAAHPAAETGRLPERLRPDFAQLPTDPGVYIFRNDAGRVIYVGKSVSIRTRARAHFAPSTGSGDWTAQAAVVDYQTTGSELGALVLENRLIKAHQPPGNALLKAVDDRSVYLSCRLDIAFPILELVRQPAAGHAVTIGPLVGRSAALELIEQLESLFGLRHCGRRLPRREHPSLYGQMGRCLSPCLGDLDPNLYRRRLEQALRLFDGPQGAGSRLVAHVEEQMRTAAHARHYERAAWLRRRAQRLRLLLSRLGGVLEATHARPRLAVAAHPSGGRPDAFWIAGGRLVDWGALPEDAGELARLARDAVAAGSRPGELGAYLSAQDVEDMRIVGGWLASHPETPQLELEPARSLEDLIAFTRPQPAPLQLKGSATTVPAVA